MKKIALILIGAVAMAAAGCNQADILDGAASSGISWSTTECSVSLDEDNPVYPTIDNPGGQTVTYSSSDESVATIDASAGEITLVAPGTTTITAYAEASGSYSAGSASYVLKVSKHTTAISWSETIVKVALEEDYTLPTLTVSPEGLSVSYSSSNENVATVSDSGEVTPVAVGTTIITAVFEGDETYKAASASYTLVVVSGDDTGAGAYTFDSTGDTSSDDDISNTTFTRMITVTYSGSSATVEGDYYGYASVSGGHVTVTNIGNDEDIVYKLTGSTTNGSFTLTSSKKQAILLSGVSITNPSGAAINNQSGKRTYVVVEGANYLYDSSSAAYSTDANTDMKAVFFSEGQLVFSGSGTLTVEAKNKKEKSCIASDDYVRIMNSPTLKLTSSSTTAGHGIRGKEYVQLSGGTTEISSAASMKKGIISENYVLVENGTHNIKITGGVGYDSEDGEYKGTAGIKADNYFGMTGGTVTITNSGSGGKGIRAGSEDFNSTGVIEDSFISGGSLTVTTTGSESNEVPSKGIKIGWAEGTENRVTAHDGGITISGGVIKVSSAKSEGFESKDHFTMTGGEVYVTSSADDAVNCTGEMKISGGYIYANSSRNDALDANGNLTLSGGYVFAVTTAGGAEVAIDCAEQKTLTIGTGVVMVAYPSIESGAKMNQSCYTMSCTAGSWNSLYNGSSNIAAFKAPSGVSTVVVSAPSLKSGYKGVSVGSTTYCNGIWATSSISGGTSVSLSSYTGGGGPGGGGRPGGGGGRW